MRAFNESRYWLTVYRGSVSPPPARGARTQGRNERRVPQGQSSGVASRIGILPNPQQHKPSYGALDASRRRTRYSTRRRTGVLWETPVRTGQLTHRPRQLGTELSAQSKAPRMENPSNSKFRPRRSGAANPSRIMPGRRGYLVRNLAPNKRDARDSFRIRWVFAIRGATGCTEDRRRKAARPLIRSPLRAQCQTGVK